MPIGFRVLETVTCVDSLKYLHLLRFVDCLERETLIHKVSAAAEPRRRPMLLRVGTSRFQFQKKLRAQLPSPVLVLLLLPISSEGLGLVAFAERMSDSQQTMCRSGLKQGIAQEQAVVEPC